MSVQREHRVLSTQNIKIMSNSGTVTFAFQPILTNILNRGYSIKNNGGHPP